MSWEFAWSRNGANTYVDKSAKLLKTVQDCQPIVDHVAAMRGQNLERDYGRPVLEIPATMVAHWAQQGYDILKMPGPELRVFLKAKGFLGSDYRRLQYDHS